MRVQWRRVFNTHLRSLRRSRRIRTCAVMKNVFSLGAVVAEDSQIDRSIDRWIILSPLSFGTNNLKADTFVLVVKF